MLQQTFLALISNSKKLILYRRKVGDNIQDGEIWQKISDCTRSIGDIRANSEHESLIRNLNQATYAKLSALDAESCLRCNIS